MLLPPPRQPKGKAKKGRSRSSSVFEARQDASEVYYDGIEPAKEDQMDIDDWEEATGKQLGPEDVDQVIKLVSWCYVKWDDLQYEQCKQLYDSPDTRVTKLITFSDLGYTTAQRLTLIRRLPSRVEPIPCSEERQDPYLIAARMRKA